jgi:chemotaxis protein methyltransferase CheR
VDNTLSGDASVNNASTLHAELAYAQSIIDTVREPILVLHGRLHVQTASRAFYDIFEVSPEETLGRFMYDLGNGQWNIPALRKLLEEVLPERKAIVDFEVTHDFPTLGPRVMLINDRQV